MELDGLLPIGELARRTNTTVSALRYYEERGLLEPAGRVSGHRCYSPDAVAVVGVIRLLSDMGFSLRETQQVFGAHDESPAAWRELIEGKLAELDDHRTRIDLARTALAHALACPHDDIARCANFKQVVSNYLEGQPVEATHHH